jgi:hypothetical protein
VPAGEDSRPKALVRTEKERVLFGFARVARTMAARRLFCCIRLEWDCLQATAGHELEI